MKNKKKLSKNNRQNKKINKKTSDLQGWNKKYIHNEPIEGLAFIRFKTSKFSNFVEECKNNQIIQQCYRLTGEYDALLEITVKNTKELFQFNRFLAKFDGLQSVDTHLVITEWRR